MRREQPARPAPAGLRSLAYGRRGRRRNADRGRGPRSRRLRCDLRFTSGPLLCSCSEGPHKPSKPLSSVRSASSAIWPFVMVEAGNPVEPSARATRPALLRLPRRCYEHQAVDGRVNLSGPTPGQAHSRRTAFAGRRARNTEPYSNCRRDDRALELAGDRRRRNERRSSSDGSMHRALRPTRNLNRSASIDSPP